MVAVIQGEVKKDYIGLVFRPVETGKRDPG
jgi:hypothetical protein